MTMLGHRARIGYCSPPFVTETFPFEFYMIVPDGVTLMITTLEIRTRTKTEVEASHARSLLAAKYMADAGADVVVLGGNPVNQSLGIENLPKLCADLAAEIGTKVVTSTQAQVEALELLGAKKVATVHCYESAHNDRHLNSMRTMGFEPAGVIACESDFQHIGGIDGKLALELSRRVKQENPEADTIHLGSAHWAVAHAIEEIENELGVSVMTSQQAILWKALRTAGINDSIAGFGRLFRDF
jgi:maleate cis-trans isomerase